MWNGKEKGLKFKKMRTYLLPFLLLAFVSLPEFSCKSVTGEEEKYPKGILVTVEVQLARSVSGGTLGVYESLGDQFQPLVEIPLESSKLTYHLRFRIPAPGLYLLGSSPQQGVFLALGKDTDLSVSVDYPYFPQTLRVLRGDESQRLMTFLRTVNEFQGAYQRLANEYWSNLQVQAPTELLKRQMDSVLRQQNAFLQEYRGRDPKTEPVIQRLANLLYFPPYSEVASAYPSEAEYVKHAFWKHMDLQDTLYGYLPHLFDKAQFYARTLSESVQSHDEVLDTLKSLIQRAPRGTRVRLLLYKGFIYGLYNTNKDLYAVIGEAFIEEFPLDPLAKKITKEVQTLARLRIGAPAPELVLQTPEGDTIRVSDFRGKITLIDFWASWCGPCRRENPNVVRLYQKYHPKGFEIFGVSLDQNREPWIRAIQQDGLVWKHGSDLKGWNSVAAQTYGVNAIPYTVLIDEQGRIIAKGLRGSQLEAFLQQLFP